MIYTKRGDQKGQHLKANSDFETIQPRKTGKFGSQDFLYQDLSMFANVPANASTTIDASGRDQFTVPSLDDGGKTAQSWNLGKNLSFHITDLLEKSI